ncbi:MAG: hypothetical protein GYA55_07330 [SAR324 cluster bacterium]|uniref:DUF4878 domain-containing protein n=1 Tax=SAR324 cluster bacterium TaxID=2024889 RepID=A0A7X9FSC3_9DELT|nr:hypothetical protein [SAR324 cluster bacterium]
MQKVVGSVFFRSFLLAGIISLAFSQSGCFLAPAIDSFKRAGLTASDRTRLLGERLKEYHEAIAWGDTDLALQYVEAEKRGEIRPIIETMSNEEKVTDTKVMSSIFDDSASNATIRIKIKSYKIPYYVVKDRIDEEEWEYSMSDGWLLKGLKRGS